jgi:hypothetical protein
MPARTTGGSLELHARVLFESRPPAESPKLLNPAEVVTPGAATIRTAL